jgi:outer membrane protein assembly factor BamB
MRPPNADGRWNGGRGDPYLDQLDPVQRETLRRLHDGDDTPAAAETFVRRLRSQLPRISPPDGASDPVQTAPAGVLVLPRPAGTGAGASTPASLRERRPARAYLELAAAGLLILAFAALLAGRDGLSTLLGGRREAPLPHAATYRGDAGRTGAMPAFSMTGEPAPRWRFTAASDQSVLTAPAVADGAVIVGTAKVAVRSGAIVAVDERTGELRWVVRTGDIVGSAPAVDGEVVYAGSADGNLYAIDVRTGKERWRLPLGGPVYESAPVVVDGVVYIQSGGAASSPAVVEGVVYVGGGARQDADSWPGAAVLHAVDARSGRERWQLSTQNAGVYAVDAATGQQRWFFQTIGPVVRTALTVAGGTVYAVSFNPDGGAGVLYAIDDGRHTERWRFEADETVPNAPAVADGTVYVAGWGGSLYAIDSATGQQRWQARIADNIQVAPVVIDGVVLLGDLGGVLHALDAASGAELWQTVAGVTISSAPTAANGSIYVETNGCLDGASPDCPGGAIVRLAPKVPGPSG